MYWLSQVSSRFICSFQIENSSPLIAAVWLVDNDIDRLSQGDICEVNGERASPEVEDVETYPYVGMLRRRRLLHSCKPSGRLPSGFRD